MPSKYDKDVRARAVRLVREHSGDYPTEWAAITAVSSRLGMSSETLRKWIRAEKHRFGVAPICRALTAHGITIAPRTYSARLSAAPSKRALWDTAVTEILAGIYEPDAAGRRPPECLYGTVKMWAHLNRQGIPVAKSTVEKIKRSHGWRGVTRAPPGAHHGPRPAHNRAPDLVRRQFKASRPGQLHVADFTYVPLDGGGFGYTALVIDAFAGLIPGWDCSLSKETAFVERAIRHAAAYRERQGRPFDGTAIQHSDAGSQYTSVHFAETLLLAGLVPSIGTVGDALDNALAETTMGLYKTECTRDGSTFRAGPIRGLADLEDCTSAWVHWYNAGRLMHRLGRRPPAEA